jgi:hypothetical protein
MRKLLVQDRQNMVVSIYGLNYYFTGVASPEHGLKYRLDADT